jgi:hypothetical protein
MTNNEIAKALRILAPEASWTLIGDDYSKIEWLCECNKPTAKQVTDKIAELPALEAAQKALKESNKIALLARLGITAEEAATLLS